MPQISSVEVYLSLFASEKLTWTRSFARKWPLHSRNQAGSWPALRKAVALTSKLNKHLKTVMTTTTDTGMEKSWSPLDKHDILILMFIIITLQHLKLRLRLSPRWNYNNMTCVKCFVAFKKDLKYATKTCQATIWRTLYEKLTLVSLQMQVWLMVVSITI